MTFKSPSGALYYYAEALICLCNARSPDIFCEKVFLPGKSRKLNTRRLDTLATIGYYVAQLSKTCRYIIGCYYLENVGSREVARRLNELQNTRRHSGRTVQEMYIANLRRLSDKLTRAGLIREAE